MRRRCCCVTVDPPTECCQNVPQPKPDWCYDPNCAAKVPSGACTCNSRCPELVNSAMPQHVLLIVSGIMAKQFLPAICNAHPCIPYPGLNGAFLLYYEGCGRYEPVKDEFNRPTGPWSVRWVINPGGLFEPENPGWYLLALWNTAGNSATCRRFNAARCDCIPPSGVASQLCIPAFAPWCNCDNSSAVAIIA